MIRSVFLILQMMLFPTFNLMADLVEQGPKDSAPSGLLAAVARADITPPVGIAQMNWGSQSHILSTGNDPVGLFATALVLSDGKDKFAMVDIDRLFVNGLEPSIERAAQLTGIPAENIRLAATHTHAAGESVVAERPSRDGPERISGGSPEVRKASPFAHTMFCGYSDGVGGGYFPMTCEYAQGGYEVERTPYGRQADEKLIAETIELFKAFRVE